MTPPAHRQPAAVRVLARSRPLRWLKAGWRDFQRAPLPSMLHGLVFLLAGSVIAAVGWHRHYLLAGAFSGFLLMAPMLMSGLYEVSRRLDRGEQPTVRDVIGVWIHGGGQMARFGVLLAVLGTAWVLLSALIILRFVGAADGGVGDFLRAFVLSPNWLPFAFWLVAGGVFAASVFAITAVSVPMMLDREVPLRTAVLTSVRAVGTNPEAMMLWASLVMGITLIGFVAVVPLVVLVPVLGHATWHAYVDTVDAADLPPRL
ncbi:MAG TPA: DUF2189 domain-containing protein [Quisquiliibacterium sp.]|nr:DUF2189 domain-containing protein [Quisquiliibacterium sp.]HQN14353.1 DUF2189 domain-containing protein [Quisquiliibacterium sp.]HQP68151.1 DUF2189 domain-containing protein [Quisquiliibacterium sp.]